MYNDSALEATNPMFGEKRRRAAQPLHRHLTEPSKFWELEHAGDAVLFPTEPKNHWDHGLKKETLRSRRGESEYKCSIAFNRRRKPSALWRIANDYESVSSSIRTDNSMSGASMGSDNGRRSAKRSSSAPPGSRMTGMHYNTNSSSKIDITSTSINTSTRTGIRTGTNTGTRSGMSTPLSVVMAKHDQGNGSHSRPSTPNGTRGRGSLAHYYGLKA